LAIAVGIASFVYHASYTRIAQFFDLSSMYFFSSLLLVFNLRRLKIVNAKTQMPLFLGVNLLSMVILAFFKNFGQAIFGLQVILALLLEFYIFKSQENKPNYKQLILALIFFIIAFIIWILDVTRIVCDPNNHFLQGHAIWHILTSFCFLFLYRFYRQFQFKN
ncbi:MAG: ceramidase domain-containing protein, partial [Planktothrix sp.]